jgi:glycosyltransferase involved in cell wall biosynthesis
VHFELPVSAASRASRSNFDQQIKPHLNGQIEYVGEVSHEEKCRLLCEAQALLVPIEWEEPFGLVMIEAMASGTPPIALNRGSVPEVIDHCRTGMIANDLDEMAAALEQVPLLDPFELRREVEQRFSAERMVDNYLVAYKRHLTRVSDQPLTPATAGRRLSRS